VGGVATQRPSVPGADMSLSPDAAAAAVAADFDEDAPDESPRVPVQRKKISIRPIPEARKRQVTFMKRKKGLLKKAKELSILCNCEMAVLIFDKHNQCFQFASGDVEETLARFERSAADPAVQREHKTNADVRAARCHPPKMPPAQDASRARRPSGCAQHHHCHPHT
jgi:hypothetical protein